AKLVDGRHLPHICAPGMNIVSAMSRHHVSNSAYNETYQPKYYSRTHKGETYHWTPMTGTSMATPYMTGVAAIWLSADPTLTTDDIIRIAQETSSEPALASDNKGESGNLNALEGLCKVLGLSSVSNIAVDNAEKISITPATGACNILAPGAESIAITIHDMAGHTVKALTAEGNSATVATDGLAKGVYLITAATRNGSATIKFNR
ncbi:MAG: S8 family serine peptidase, partial [Muribaculaceae bacterium]|nr:S8 family serine peptidase [Muribaculaceae bacterium]